MKKGLRHLLYPVAIWVECVFACVFLVIGCFTWVALKATRKDTQERRLSTLYDMETTFWEGTRWGRVVDHQGLLRVARLVVRSEWWNDRNLQPIVLVDSSLAHGLGARTLAYVNSGRPMEIRLCKKEMPQYVVLHEVGHCLNPTAAHRKTWLHSYVGLVRRHVGLRTAVCLYIVLRMWVSEEPNVPTDLTDEKNG